MSKNIKIVLAPWKKRQTPTLIVDFASLVSILREETGLLSDDDIGRLLGSLHARAALAEQGSTQEALDAWDQLVQELEE